LSKKRKPSTYSTQAALTNEWIHQFTALNLVHYTVLQLQLSPQVSLSLWAMHTHFAVPLVLTSHSLYFHKQKDRKTRILELGWIMSDRPKNIPYLECHFQYNIQSVDLLLWENVHSKYTVYILYFGESNQGTSFTSN